MRGSLGLRVGPLGAHAPVGCPACRAAPPLVILWPEDPAPPASCPACGRPLTGTTRVRFVQLDWGPA